MKEIVDLILNGELVDIIEDKKFHFSVAKENNSYIISTTAPADFINYYVDSVQRVSLSEIKELGKKLIALADALKNRSA